MRLLAVLVAGALALSGCVSEDEPIDSGSGFRRYPDVLDVTVEATGKTYTFDVTISSPYDSPDRYADGWRIKGEDGTVYAKHTLGHHHATEQPFTRTQTNVRIPASVETVIVEGHDKQYGYGGTTETVTLP